MKNACPQTLKLFGFLAFLFILMGCGSAGHQNTPENEAPEIEAGPVFPSGFEESYYEPPAPVLREPLTPEQIAYNQKKDKEFNSLVPGKVWKVLKEYDAGFQPFVSGDFANGCGQPWIELKPEDDEEGHYQYVPWGVRGDFDEDGKNDFALLGHNETSGLLLVVMKRGSSWEVIEIFKDNSPSEPEKYGVDCYLEFQENSYISIPYEDYGFPMHGDGIVVDHCNGRAMLHYMNEEGEFTAFPLTEGPD